MTVFGLLFSGTSLVVADDYSLPNIEQHANDIVVSEQDGQRWITRPIDPDHATTTYPTHQLLPLRLLLTQWDSVAFERASRALQLLDWSRTHQHCGCCGTAMQPHATGEMAQVCPACAHTAYPRINPCVIVAIRRDNTILLARAQRFTVPAGGRRCRSSPRCRSRHRSAMSAARSGWSGPCGSLLGNDAGLRVRLAVRVHFLEMA